MKIRIIFALMSVVALAAVGTYPMDASSAQAVTQAVKADAVPGQYIVVFHDDVADVDAATDEMEKNHGLGVLQRYGHAIKGFAATIPEAALDTIRNDPRVAFISEDYLVYAQGKPEEIVQAAQVIPTGIQRVMGLSTPTNKGTGIGVAVIDTGIDLSHPDLKANIAAASKTCVRGTKSANDDNGHGAHVAGTIAALDNGIGVIGVAPEAKLFAVKVLNKYGMGTWSGVICGIDWVTANAATYGIKVANMSLGGGGASDNNCGNTNNDALHKAICRSTAAGVTYVVAAGNSAADTASAVPAAYDDTVVTVSALADSDGQAYGNGPATPYGPDDTFATFSNYGSAVDLGAPGVQILSTWKGGGYNTISGTSMAAPHVAGAAALYSKSHPGTTWTQVRDGLKALGELLNLGHTDPSGMHPENVLQTGAL